MQGVPKLTQEDIIKLLGDNQNFLMLLKCVVAQSDQDVVEVPMSDIHNIIAFGLRVEPQHDEGSKEPRCIRLSLVPPQDK